MIAIGIALLCVAASTSLRFTPGQAQLVSAVGLGLVGVAALGARRAFPMVDRSGDPVARLPDRSVPDIEAIYAMVATLDAQRRFPPELRAAIFEDVSRLRRATPARQRSARVALQREVLTMLREPPRVRVLRALRGVGPALLAIGFVIIWTLAFLLVWSLDAHESTGAFNGFGPRAELGDVMYLAVSGAVGGTPPQLEARTNVAQTLVAAEFACGALLLGAYATSLMRSQRESQVTHSSLAIASRAPVLDR